MFGRRTFLMGLGAFTGGALVLPKVPTIFDMGRVLAVGPADVTLDGVAYRLRPPAAYVSTSLPTVFSRFYLLEAERAKVMLFPVTVNVGQSFNFPAYGPLALDPLFNDARYGAPPFVVRSEAHE